MYFELILTEFDQLGNYCCLWPQVVDLEHWTFFWLLLLLLFLVLLLMLLLLLLFLGMVLLLPLFPAAVDDAAIGDAADLAAACTHALAAAVGVGSCPWWL